MAAQRRLLGTLLVLLSIAGLASCRSALREPPGLQELCRGTPAVDDVQADVLCAKAAACFERRTHEEVARAAELWTRAAAGVPDRVEPLIEAVRARVWPLLRYDPDADGVFGLRLDLDGNPSPDTLLVAGVDDDAPEPAAWAAPERRYAASFAASSGDGPSMTAWIQTSPDVRGATAPTVPGPNGMRLDVGETLRRAVARRLGHWRTLQELAGVETPFTDRVRDRITSETESAHRAALDELRQDYEARLEDQRRSLDAAQVGRLRERLLQLAGYDPSRVVTPTTDDDPGTESGS